MSFIWDVHAPRLYMDIETQSTCNLRKFGGRAYAADPTTRLLSAVFCVEGKYYVYYPDGVNPYYSEPTDYNRASIEQVKQWAREYIWVAHNAETFDAVVWRHLHPDIQPRWMDTLHFCRLAGYPGGLDAASKAMGGRGKADTTAMKLLTHLKARNGLPVYPVGTPQLWQQLEHYNIQDVEELVHIGETVIKDVGFELRAMQFTSDKNARGVYVDQELLQRQKDIWVLLREESVDRLAELTGGKLTDDNIGSVKQVKAYLLSLGFYVDSLNQATVNQILQDPEGYIERHETEDIDDARLAVAVLAERQNAVRATVGKLNRVLSVLDSDGVVRNITQYHGAGTGRESGRDLQPHNFPRGYTFDDDGSTLAGLLDDLTVDSIKAAAAKTKHPNQPRQLTPAEALTTLSRSIIRARPGHALIMADYSAIEARVVLWLARCEHGLATFRTGADIYLKMASELYGRPLTKKDKDERQLGKICILALGFGMGKDKFALTCKTQLVDLDKAGINPEHAVRTYRTTFPEVVQLWRDYENAMRNAIRNPGETYVAGRCRFGYGDGMAYIQQPSGRRLQYRNARFHWAPPKWAPTGEPVEGIVYQSPYGFMKSVYGGLIAENITQAVARDIMMEHSVNCPLPIVLNVHDEIVPEVLYAERELRMHELARAMTVPPDWGQGIPLQVEAFTGIHYTKSGIPGQYSCKYADGILRS